MTDRREWGNLPAEPANPPGHAREDKQDSPCHVRADGHDLPRTAPEHDTMLNIFADIQINFSGTENNRDIAASFKNKEGRLWRGQMNSITFVQTD